MNTLCDSIITNPQDESVEQNIEKLQNFLSERQALLDILIATSIEDRKLLKQPELVELDKQVQNKMQKIFSMMRENVQTIRSKRRVSQAYRQAPDSQGSYFDLRK